MLIILLQAIGELKNQLNDQVQSLNKTITLTNENLKTVEKNLNQVHFSFLILNNCLVF